MIRSIGENLKKERKVKGLSQSKFVEGIISESFYSKVEREVNEISAKDLISILQKNKISIVDFFQLKNNENQR